MTENKKEKTFEEAFVRLEKILEKMNAQSVSLDESLKLYEEADGLIQFCGKRLHDAERKIEMLIKKRNGELEIGDDQQPTTEDFSLNG